MQYTLIKGTFHVVSQSPDADSVKFRALDNSLWAKIDTDNRAVFDRNFAEDNGVVTIRLEGIDALETHYSAMNPPTPDDIKLLKNIGLPPPAALQVRQPSDMATTSTNALLSFLGVSEAKWRTFGKSRYISEARIQSGETSVVIKKKLEDRIPGYVICGDIEQNGRPVAFVFVGETAAADGVTVPTEQLAANLHYSANYHLLQRGMVYPLYFMSLAGKLRAKLTEATQQALNAARITEPISSTAISNIWQLDASTQGVDITSLAIITEQKAVYPYLFRKVIKHVHRCNMSDYWDAVRANSTVMPPGRITLDGFFNDANPYVYVASEGDFVRLSEVVTARGTTLKMIKPPYDLVFLSG
jgi:hypothetical protein